MDFPGWNKPGIAVPSSLSAMNPPSQGLLPLSGQRSAYCQRSANTRTAAATHAGGQRAGGIALGLSIQPLSPALTALSNYNKAQRELRQKGNKLCCQGAASAESFSLRSAKNTAGCKFSLLCCSSVAAISPAPLLLASPQTAPGLLLSR